MSRRYCCVRDIRRGDSRTSDLSTRDRAIRNLCRSNRAVGNFSRSNRCSGDIRCSDCGARDLSSGDCAVSDLRSCYGAVGDIGCRYCGGSNFTASDSAVFKGDRIQLTANAHVVEIKISRRGSPITYAKRNVFDTRRNGVRTAVIRPRVRNCTVTSNKLGDGGIVVHARQRIERRAYEFCCRRARQFIHADIKTVRRRRTAFNPNAPRQNPTRFHCNGSSAKH